ncbi:STAS domain-containing protein [Akkermansiaceae bacterium]|nr:STAS domain-containing protein [Akkermansiaceae bacterium]
MINQNSILASHESEFSWIRCEGKGSFKNSPRLKDWCESEIKNGATCIVIDLEACKGMDSTFMGTLAGLAMRLQKIPAGQMQVVDPGDKNLNSLEGLGLDSLMQIDPADATWQSNVSEIRSKLEPCQPDVAPLDQGSDILEAHKKLCEADIRNKEKFSDVINCLETELKNK